MQIVHRLSQVLTAPSPRITEPDQQRQASLLSAFLIGTIVLAVIVESITTAMPPWDNYTGYRQTILVVSALLVIYFISRTQYVRLAAALTVIIGATAVLVIAWANPDSVLGGILDYLILPLWLASIYLTMRALMLFVTLTMAGLLALPFAGLPVSLNDILIGPFSFMLATSILLTFITRHRNSLEGDRRKQLAEKEEHSRKLAARAEALLRVAERLNSHLDLDSLLQSICEEAARALDTPVALVALYDNKLNALRITTGVGIPMEIIQSMTPIPLEKADSWLTEFGSIPDLPNSDRFSPSPTLEIFRSLQLTSLSFAIMEHEGEIIGGLSTFAQGNEHRHFGEDELLLLQGIARQAALAIINTRLFKDARRRLEHLQALRAIDLAIISNRDIRDTLDVLLEQITRQLRVDAAVILLMDEYRQQLEYGASRGFRTATLRFTRLRLGDGVAGRAALENKLVHIPDLRTDPQTLAFASSLSLEGFVSYYAAPLFAQGKMHGVLEIFHRSALDPDTEWLSFLEALAGQAAIAIENTSLLQDLQRTNEELSKAYDSTIEGWSHALDLRDKETEGHTQRVTEMTIELARQFGFSEAELVHIRRGALLHDIGKMGVPDRILLKEGKLTEEEWQVMRKHPGFAHEMLLPIHYLRPALDIPYCHHEKWDGTGYPRGLKGEEIPLTARIFAVVDVWDALTSDRPYRPAWTRQRALAHIRASAGSHFDPQVVEAFVQLLERKGILQNTTA
jgi:HD-GYP domain-containing protein (c-di-GMP phosphodiesterase class II)